MNDDTFDETVENPDRLRQVAIRFPRAWWKRIQYAAIDVEMKTSAFIRHAVMREVARIEKEASQNPKRPGRGETP
jgi:hypothetical protein